MTSIALTGNVGIGRPARIAPDLVDRVINIMLVVFLFFFFIGSRLTLLGLPLHAEDLLFLALVPFSYRYVARPKSQLFYWIAAYFAMNFIPYFVELASGEYSLSIYPIVLVKELEFVYIAYLVSANRSPWVLGTVDVLALIIIGNGVRSILTRQITYYGIGTFGAYDAPSLAGAIFLFSSIWIHIRSRLLTRSSLRRLAVVVVVCGSACAVATVSRSTIAAMVVYWATYLILSSVWALPWVAMAVVAVPIAIQWAAQTVDTTYGLFAARIIGRVVVAGSAANTRSAKWKFYLDATNPLDFIFGRGKGYPNALDKTLGLGVDNQYVRIILENGIVGMVILIVVMVMMLREIRRRGGEYRFAWATMMAMLVLCIPLEALQVSKSGGFFWLTMFYLLMCQRRHTTSQAIG